MIHENARFFGPVTVGRLERYSKVIVSGCDQLSARGSCNAISNQNTMALCRGRSMNIAITRLAFSILLAALCLTGCATDTIYRERYEALQSKIGRAHV